MKGFSLAELILAIALFTVAILGMVGLSISVLRTDRKTADTSVGSSVARQVLLQTVDQARTDQPAGTRAAFWAANSGTVPYSSGIQKANQTDYQYKVYAQNVTDTAGANVGAVAQNNLLKKVDVVVWWWNSDQTQHTGYGVLQVTASRLVSQADL